MKEPGLELYSRTPKASVVPQYAWQYERNTAAEALVAAVRLHCERWAGNVKVDDLVQALSRLDGGGNAK